MFKKSNRTWSTHRHLSPKAVFFVERAATDEVVPIGAGKAAFLINANAARYYLTSSDFSAAEQRETEEQLFATACTLAKEVSAFILRVSLHGSFWRNMEAALSEVP